MSFRIFKELGDAVSFGILKLGNMSFGMLTRVRKYELWMVEYELGDVSFGINNEKELGNMSFGILKLDDVNFRILKLGLGNISNMSFAILKVR